jgi:hypothetical protein
MNPAQITKLLNELRELALLDDPAFAARTQSKRVCREAMEVILELVQEVHQLNATIEILGEQ